MVDFDSETVEAYLSVLQGLSFVGFVSLYIPFHVGLDEVKKEYVVKMSPIQTILCICQHIHSAMNAINAIWKVLQDLYIGEVFLFLHPSNHPIFILLEMSYIVATSVLSLYWSQLALFHLKPYAEEMAKYGSEAWNWLKEEEKQKKKDGRSKK